MFTEAPRPTSIRQHRNAGWFAVATVCFGAFMGQLDASIVTLTFPALQREFAAPLAAVEWVSLTYLLALVGLLAAAGRLADAAGRKLMYLYGFAVFTAASVACGLAPGLGWLLGFRVVQAVGAAMLQANSVALVVTSVAPEKRRAALGVQAAAQALGLAMGPALGGILVNTVGWRWVFLVNLPVGILGIVAGRFLLPRTQDRTPVGRFDGAGLVLLAVASSTLLLTLSGVSGLGLPANVVVLLAVAAVAATWAFGKREQRAANPLVSLAVLRPAPVSFGLIGALCGYLVLFGPLTLFPQVLGTTDSVGLILTCLPAGFALAALTAERVLPRRIGPRGRAMLGAAAAAVACAALAFQPKPAVLIGALLFLLGLGLGVFIPANNSSIMDAVPERMSAMGGGLVSMARGLGTAFGVAVVTLFLHAGGKTTGAVGAFVAFVVFAAIAGATALAAGEPSNQQYELSL